MLTPSGFLKPRSTPAIEGSHSKQTRYKYYAVVSIFLIGVFLRFFLLTNQSLWMDEGFSLHNSDGASWLEMFARVRSLPTADKFQPLYYWLLFGVRQLFGDSETVLRGLSAVLGSLTLALVYAVALRFYGQRHAFYALCLATFSALLIFLSQEVRNYALILFLSALQLYFISGEITSKTPVRPSSKWIFSTVTGLALFCSVQTAVFSASLSLSHLLCKKDWKAWLAWWVPVGLFAIPAVLYYLALPGQTDPGTVAISRSGFPILFNMVFVIYGLLVGSTYGPSQESLRLGNRFSIILESALELVLLLGVGLVIAYFLQYAILARQRKSQFQEANFFFFYLLLFSFILGTVLALATGMNWVPRHSSFMGLSGCLLLPAAFCWPRTSGIRTHRFHWVARLSVIALIVLNIYSSFNYYFKPAYARADYRGVAEYIADRSSPSTQSILMIGDLRLMDYYGSAATLQPASVLQKVRAGDPLWLNALNQVTDGYEDIFVIVNRLSRVNALIKGDLRKELSNSYQVVDEVDRYLDFNIFHLESQVVP
ncbi:MAG: glycosyltransferase family 39 protein [Thermosynechococcaceae cyanobacterium]